MYSINLAKQNGNSYDTDSFPKIMSITTIAILSSICLSQIILTIWFFVSTKNMFVGRRFNQLKAVTVCSPLKEPDVKPLETTTEASATSTESSSITPIETKTTTEKSSFYQRQLSEMFFSFAPLARFFGRRTDRATQWVLKEFFVVLNAKNTFWKSQVIKIR